LYENILNIRTHIIGMQQEGITRKYLRKPVLCAATLWGDDGHTNKESSKADEEQQQVIMLSHVKTEYSFPIWENSKKKSNF